MIDQKDRRDDLRIRGIENRESRDSITRNSCGILEGGSRGIRADIRPWDAPLQRVFGIHVLARSCRQNLTHGQLNADFERVVDESRCFSILCVDRKLDRIYLRVSSMSFFSFVSKKKADGVIVLRESFERNRTFENKNITEC